MTKLIIKVPWPLKSWSASGPRDSSQKSQQDLSPGLCVQCLMQQSPDCSGSGRVALGDDEFFQERCLGRHIHASWIQQIQEGGGRRLFTQANTVWVWNYWDVPRMVIRDLQITRKISSSEWVQQSSAASFQTSHIHPGLVWLSSLEVSVKCLHE